MPAVVVAFFFAFSSLGALRSNLGAAQKAAQKAPAQKTQSNLGAPRAAPRTQSNLGAPRAAAGPVVMPALGAVPAAGPLQFRPVEPISEWRRPAAVGLGASAVLLAGAGLIFGMQAHDAHRRLSAHLGSGGVWDEMAAADMATRRHAELMSIGAFVAAGAGAAAACWLGFGGTHRGPDIRVARAGGAWGLALRGSF